MGDAEAMLSSCLFFTAGALAREMQRMAEESFAPTGLNPSQGFALLCVVDEPGVQPSVIAGRLALAASTVTRLIDTLRRRRLIDSEVAGRTIRIVPTPAGEALAAQVRVAWKDFYERYCAIIGQERADGLCAMVHDVNQRLLSGGDAG